MKTALFLTALVLAVAAAGQKSSFAITGFGGADITNSLLQAEVAAGLWQPKKGGPFLGGKVMHENRNNLPVTTYRLTIGYHASITIGRKLISPYGAIGRRYAEAGCNLYLPVNSNTKAGLRAGVSTNGFVLGISFIAIQNSFTIKKL